LFKFSGIEKLNISKKKSFFYKLTFDNMFKNNSLFSIINKLFGKFWSTIFNNIKNYKIIYVNSLTKYKNSICCLII